MAEDNRASSENVQKEEEEEEVDISCGIWKCRTNIFGRKFSNLFVFSFLMGFSSMFSRMVGEVLRVQMVAIERQFNIDNSQVGLLFTAAMAGTVSTLVWGGHFVKNLHIPAIVGISGVLQGIVLAIPSLLQFTNPYTLEQFDTGPIDQSSMISLLLCQHHPDSNITFPQPEVKDEDTTAYNVLLVVNIVYGMLGTFHSGFLPSVYMDDNIEDKSKMAIFFGINSVIMIFSQPLGRWLSGYFTEIPVDLKATDMSPKDPRFISAWWLVYLVLGIGVAVTSLPVMLLPRRLISRKKQLQALEKATITFSGGHIDEDVQDTQAADGHQNVPDISLTEPNGGSGTVTINKTFEKQKERRRSSQFLSLKGPTERRVSLTGSLSGVNIAFNQPVKENKDSSSVGSFIDLIKDFPGALFRLLKNPAYSLILIDIAVLAIPNIGIGAFKQIYMVYEFAVPIKDVTDYSALSTAISNFLGTVISTYLATRVTTKMGYLWIIFGSYLIGTLVSPLYIILGCDDVDVRGLVNDRFSHPVDTSQAGCMCSPFSQLLSCGDDGNTYLSPCFAGCNSTVTGLEFYGCSLLEGNATSLTPGPCPTDSVCQRNFILYIMLHGIQAMVENMSNVPRNLFVLRLVAPTDRAFAVSLFAMVFFIIAMPAPKFFGGILDSMCILHRDETCMVYDRDDIRYLVGGIDVGTLGIVQITIVLILIVTKVQDWRPQKQQKQMEMDSSVKP